MEEEELEQFIEQVRLDPSIITLNLSNSCLKSLPESIGTLYNLTTIDLTGYPMDGLPNYLTSIPESIGSLSNLAKLYLHNNRLTSLPESIRYLHSLTELDKTLEQIILYRIQSKQNETNINRLINNK